MEELKYRKLETEAEIKLVLEIVLTRFRNDTLVSINTDINRLEEERDTYDWDQESDDELQTFYKEKNDLDQLTPDFFFSSIFSHKAKDNLRQEEIITDEDELEQRMYILQQEENGLKEEEKIMYFLCQYLQNKANNMMYWDSFNNKTMLEVFDFFEVDDLDWNGNKFKFYQLILKCDEEIYISFRKIEDKHSFK